MLATETQGSTSTGVEPFSCASSNLAPAPSGDDERTVPLADFLADRDLDANHKHLLLTMHIHAGPGREYAGDNTDLARITGLYHDDGRPNKRFLLRLIGELEGRGLLARKPGGRNGRRAALVLTGPRIDLATVAASSVTQGDTESTPQAATSPVTQQPAPSFRNQAGPRSLTGPELAKFERLAKEARACRKVAARYECARYFLEHTRAGRLDPSLTVPAVSDALGVVWRDGPESLSSKQKPAGVALVTAGVVLKRVPGFAAG